MLQKRKIIHIQNVLLFLLQQLVESILQYANIVSYSAKLVLIFANFFKINFIKNLFFTIYSNQIITTLSYVLGYI